MAELRPGSTADLAEVLVMNNAAVPAVSQLDHEALQALAADATALVVAEWESQLRGFLLLLSGPGLGYESLNYRWFSERYDRFLYVDRVVVDPSAQRRGLGRRFYDHAVELGMDSYPYLCAEVNTRPRNHDSLAFHEALGFDTVGSQDTEGGTKTVAMLAKPLTESDA